MYKAMAHNYIEPRGETRRKKAKKILAHYTYLILF